jgi:hypothetical protein
MGLGGGLHMSMHACMCLCLCPQLSMPCPHIAVCRQPLVPVVNAEDGRWLVTRPLRFMMKPGGHGAIWKLMHDEGESA